MNKDIILDIFYSNKGNLDQINAAIDARFEGARTRKISTFEAYIKTRISLNPKVLKMVNLDITPVEAAYLSLYPPLKDLEVLDLRKNMIGDDGINAIAQSEVLSDLRKLDVRSNLITRVGMMAFAESKTLTNLESLDLRMNKLGKRWEEKIKEKGNFSNLVDVKTV